MKIRLPVSAVESSLERSSAEKRAPTVDYINSVWGEISKYGTKLMPDGKIYVIHGLTNQPVERHEVIPAGSDGKGNIIYLRAGEKMRPGLDIVYPSVWKNPTKVSL